MFGIGGGVVIVPVLAIGLGYRFQMATGTSLTALLFPTNFYAIKKYRKKYTFSLRTPAFIAMGIFIGNAFGAFVANYAAWVWLLYLLFALYQIVCGVKYIRPIHTYRRLRHLPIKDSVESYTGNIVPVPALIAIGLLAGLLSGLFGIGGGIIITTVLISFYGINPQIAIAISLCAMFLPVGLGGAFVYWTNGNVEILGAILIAVGIEIGSSISSNIALKINGDLMKQVFGVFLLILGGYYIYKTLLLL